MAGNRTARALRAPLRRDGAAGDHAPRRGRPTRTAGTTTRSPSASRAATRRPGRLVRAAPGYSGPDKANASVSGSCTDVAGNTRSRSFALKYDATAPQVTGATAVTCARPERLVQPRAQRQLLGQRRHLGDRLLRRAQSYSGPDTPTPRQRPLPRRRRQHGRRVASRLKYDATARAVTATPSRARTRTAGTTTP